MDKPSNLSTRAQAPETSSPMCKAHPFQVYLTQQRLSWVAVAREAHLPSLLVWSLAHGVPVRDEQAMRVREAVRRLSGVAYTGPIQISTEVGQAPKARATGTLPTHKEVPR